MSAASPVKPVRPLTLLLLVFVGLVSSLAPDANRILLHAVDLRLHLGTASCSEHEQDHVAGDHGGHGSEEMHRYAIRLLCNSQTDFCYTK